MLWLLGAVTYAAVAVLLARPLAGELAWRMFDAEKREWPTITNHREPKPMQWACAACCAILVTSLWMVVLPCAGLWRIAGRRPIGREREQRLKEQRARIAELERELDLR